MGVRTKKKDQNSPIIIAIVAIGAFFVVYWPVAVALLVILIIVYAVHSSKKEKEQQEDEERLKRLRQEKHEMEMRLLAVQNAISPVHSESLSGTPGQIEQRFKSYVANHTEASNAAIEQQNKAANPKTFFEAEDKYQLEIKALCRAEKQDVYPLKPNPSDVKADHEANLPGNINDMLSRMWQSCRENAAALKTMRGKQNRIKSFFEVNSLYTDRFFPENVALIEQKKEEAREQYGLEAF